MAIEITVLWAGGWDKYSVDETQVRDITLEEQLADSFRMSKGWGGDPTIRGDCGWLRAGFFANSQDWPSNIPIGPH